MKMPRATCSICHRQKTNYGHYHGQIVCVKCQIRSEMRRVYAQHLLQEINDSIFKK